MELLRKSKGLKDANLNCYDKLTIDKILELQERQNKVYKQWLFYDNFIKASEKILQVENNSRG